MKRFFLGLVTILLFCNHDMFLKLDTYHLAPDQAVVIRLFNGTFEHSENSIDRSRMQNVTLVSPAGKVAPSLGQWKDHGNETHLSIRTNDPGTYLVGVSTKGRIIELKAEDFNDYLYHDGIVDVLEDRKRTSTLDHDARELYSKHVKTIFQVGESQSNHYRNPLGYPIEFIPQSNPYKIKAGGTIDFLLLRNNQPLSQQLVYAGQSHKSLHAKEGQESHSHRDQESQYRTDDSGIVTIKFEKGGPWYIRTIHMEMQDHDRYNYESNWATLTFAVDH